jgi:hypothetical protein
VGVGLIGRGVVAPGAGLGMDGVPIFVLGIDGVPGRVLGSWAIAAAAVAARAAPAECLRIDRRDLDELQGTMSVLKSGMGMKKPQAVALHSGQRTCRIPDIGQLF